MLDFAWIVQICSHVTMCKHQRAEHQNDIMYPTVLCWGNIFIRLKNHLKSWRTNWITWNFMVPHARTAIKQHVPYDLLDCWSPPGTVSYLNCMHSLLWDLFSSFYKLLKSFLFTQAWAESTSE